MNDHDTGVAKQEKKRSWWAIGAVLLYIITKAKPIFTLLKSAKITAPVISMLISIGTYALIYPIGFAVGLVLMIFIHEIGHVLAAKQRGLPVTAPVFIPFVGAFIMMKKHPRDAVTEAYLAYGGPFLGTLGAIGALLLGLFLESELLLIIANVAVLINLINLLPIHPLDGGRISVAVTRWLWLVGLIGGLIVIFYLRSLLFFLIWCMFAWDLFRKYVWKRKSDEHNYTLTQKIHVPMESLEGLFIPGEDHRQALPVQTYSNLDGKQFVVIEWKYLGVRKEVELMNQAMVHSIEVCGVKNNAEGERLQITFEVKYSDFAPDRYYEVPASLRWKFGIAYGGLAVLLIGLLYWIPTLENYPTSL